MLSDDEVIEAMQQSKAVLVDSDAERERLNNLKEMCRDWWLSPEGRETVKRAKDKGWKHKENE